MAALCVLSWAGSDTSIAHFGKLYLVSHAVSPMIAVMLGNLLLIRVAKRQGKKQVFSKVFISSNRNRINFVFNNSKNIPPQSSSIKKTRKRFLNSVLYQDKGLMNGSTFYDHNQS